MAITELALLSLPNVPSTSPLPASITNSLRTAIEVLERHSGHAFCLFRVTDYGPDAIAPHKGDNGDQAKEGTRLLLLGGWASVSAHVQDFLPSEENQALLSSLEGECDVNFMVHVDAEPSDRFTETHMVIGRACYDTKEGNSIRASNRGARVRKGWWIKEERDAGSFVKGKERDNEAGVLIAFGGQSVGDALDVGAWRDWWVAEKVVW